MSPGNGGGMEIMMKKRVFLLGLVMSLVLSTGVFAKTLLSGTADGVYLLESSLVRNTSTGKVTASSRRAGPSGTVGVQLQVTDITYGVQSFPWSFHGDIASISYTPQYMPTDTIGATSAHRMKNSSGVVCLSTVLNLP